MMDTPIDIIKDYWHQIVMFLGLVWALSRRFGEIDRRIEIEETKTEENTKKIQELFKLHNAGIERMLRRLDKD